MAKSLGATDCINTSKMSGTLIQEVWKLTEGDGTTVTVDATGVVPLIQQGVEFTANQGKMILLGVAPMDAGLQIAIVPYMTVSLRYLIKSSYLSLIANHIQSRQESRSLAAWKVESIQSR